jgi:hypothetical protein
LAVAAYTMAYRLASALATGEVKRQAGIKLKIMLATTFRDIRRSRRVSTSTILKRNAYVMGVTLSGTGVRNAFTLSDPAALKEPTDRRGRVSSLRRGA